MYLFLAVNVITFGVIFYLIISQNIQNLRNTWSLYRCNPLYMPLSDNIAQDFTYCVQNTQVNFMGFLLEPLTFITSNLSNMGSEMTGTLNNFRSMISNIRTFLSSITGNIMGVFMNLIVAFQKIMISIQDLVGKIDGIITSVLYLMDGGMKTGNSLWNGPFGQQVRALGGNCFHPDTLLYLKDGSSVEMKNAELGSRLSNGSTIISVMKLIKSSKDILYKLNNGEKQPIYVTGSHYIFSDKFKRYIKVSSHSDATIVDIDDVNNCSYFCCLITSDHIIKIGKRIFYDYDDDILELYTTLFRI